MPRYLSRLLCSHLDLTSVHLHSRYRHRNACCRSEGSHTPHCLHIHIVLDQGGMRRIARSRSDHYHTRMSLFSPSCLMLHSLQYHSRRSAQSRWSDPRNCLATGTMPEMLGRCTPHFRMMIRRDTWISHTSGMSATHRSVTSTAVARVRHDVHADVLGHRLGRRPAGVACKLPGRALGAYSP